jgi:hypothetical protein
MSGVVIPGTLVQMRTLRRFHHYNAGELIAVPMDAAQDLARKRLAEPLQLLVPTQVAAGASASAAPRQPGSTVRK